MTKVPAVNVPIACLGGLLLLALALRLVPFNQNRFLEDEALYAYWGLQIATGVDPMLDREPVDKPPLHPYTLALSFLLLGENETAARLPSLFSSMIGILLVYLLGTELYHDRWIGCVAAMLLALSAFDILFASTAFTDPLMVAWVLAALLAAARQRLGTAGVLAGLAVATKQQGLLFLPLVIVIALVSATSTRAHATAKQAFNSAEKERSPSWAGQPAAKVRQVLRISWVRFALGFALVLASVVTWDAARQQRPGFFGQGLLSYGRLFMAAPPYLGQRSIEWLRLVADFWASGLFYGLLGLLVLVWLAGAYAGWWRGPSRVDCALGGFSACYLGLHLLVGFQIWDRYLLPLVPLFALLAARPIVGLGEAFRPGLWRAVYAAVLGLVIILLLAEPVRAATQSELPVGSDHGAYDGIDELASVIRSEARPGAVLYHHWLGHHYRFYLYGADLRMHWYPDLQDLVQDATVYRREPRFIAFPSWRDRMPAVMALAQAGIRLAPVLETIRRDGSVSFRLFRLEGP